MLSDHRLFRPFQFILFVVSFCFGQIENQNINLNNNWFILSSYGVQISGIKSEDFLQSNVSPAFTLGIGKWISPEIALQIGYKGFYFHTIADDDKHNYNYINGSVLFNINEIINFTEYEIQKISFIVESGAGYFYNKYYRRPNICLDFGILITKNIKDRIQLFTKYSSIIGWDIYQNNEDILPSASLGLIYSIE